jgi:hypothetical protein
MTVQDLLFAVLPRLQESSGVDILQAANAAVRSIGKRLAWRRSDLVKEPVELDFEAEAYTVLPSVLLGFAEDPYAVSGTSKLPLTPLRPGDRADLDREGTPQRYELIGRKLYLFPYPSAPLTLKGMGFQLPSELTGMDDSLPWSGIMDELLVEAVYRIGSVGLVHAVDPVFEAYVDQELERLLPVRAGARPRRASGYHY